MNDLIANIGNIKICYEIFGKGFPTILLHGFAMYKEFWIGQTNDLAKYFKLITIDNRSCGKSDHPLESYGMEDLVKDVRGLMGFLKLEKAHIIGHSLGGMVAQNFTLKYPNRVNKLVLIATLPKFPGDISGLEMYKNSQISGYKAKLKDPESAFYDKMKRRFTRNFFKSMNENTKNKFHGIFSTEDLMKMEKSNGNSNEQDIINLTNAIAKHNTLDHLHKIKNSTLILAGEKDKITPLISSEEMHNRITNSTLRIFEGGHFFPLEFAPEVNKIILDFLQS